MDVITIEQAAELLLAAITAIVAGGLGSAPITTFLVSVLKHIPALNVVPASTLQFVTGFVLTVIFWIAQALGVEVQLQSVMDFALVVGPAILGLLATLSGSSLWYQAAKKTGAGFVGYQRPASLSERFAAPHDARG